MKNILVGFRTEAYSGSGIRDIASVLQHEIAVSQNIDCLKTCFEYIKNTDFGKTVGKVLGKVEKFNNVFDITMLPVKYRENNGNPFFKEMVQTLSKEVNTDLKYALWLSDKKFVMGFDEDRIYGGNSQNTDMYIQGQLILCDAGDRGALFGYPYKPQALDIHKEYEVRQEMKQVHKDTDLPMDVPGITVEMRAAQAACLLKKGIKLDKNWLLGTDEEVLLGKCLTGENSDSVWEQLADLAQKDVTFGQVIANDSEFFLGKGKDVENAVWRGLCNNFNLKSALSVGLKWMGQNDLSIKHLESLMDFYKESKSFFLIKTNEGFTFLPLGSPKVSYDEKINFLENRDIKKMYLVHRDKGIRLVDKEEARSLIKDASRDFVANLQIGDMVHFRNGSYLCSTDNVFLKMKSVEKFELEKPVLRVSKDDIAKRLQIEPCNFVSYKVVTPAKILNLINKVNSDDLLYIPYDGNIKDYPVKKSTSKGDRYFRSKKKQNFDKNLSDDNIIR